MSIAGGLHVACERGRCVGCDCIQVFVKNQRQWRAPRLTDEAVRAWHGAREKSGLDPVIAHDCYLINLAAPDSVVFHRSIDAFVDELNRCESLAIPCLVTHPGSHSGAGEARGIRQIVRALNAIHRRTRGFSVRTLLETTAGQGTSIGFRFEHLAEIIDRVREPDRVGVCFDTCHVFAAGYDLATPAGYAETMSELDRHLGIGSVRCFHMNNSLRPLGSRVDRHAHIREGRMSRSAFRRLVNDERFLGVPMIIETPKGMDSRGRDLDKLNLDALRRLISTPGRRRAARSSTR